MGTGKIEELKSADIHPGMIPQEGNYVCTYKYVNAISNQCN